MPAVPGLDVAAAYRAAGQGDEVGGDFYDVFERRDGEWVVVIGDVRGKGAEAAAVTALVRYTLRATAIHVDEPARVLEVLNQALLRQNVDSWCTVAYATLRCPSGPHCPLTVACGGHPLPIRIGASSPPQPVGRPGTLMGAMEDVTVSSVVTELERGDAVVFFTDGVTEGRGPQGFFGDDRLVELLATMRGKPAAEIAEGLVTAVVDFQQGMPRDDIAVLVLRLPPEG
jgi:sigma-B regulation protein RsbU (phosphoserine phosphatase)